MGLLQLAIPVFLGLLAAEVLVGRLRGRTVHRLADSVTDLGCGILSQLTGIFLAVVALTGYRYVEKGWSLQQLLGAPEWPRGVAGWVAAFLLVDLGQYLIHRLSHRVAFLWACHVVHHSSEELNFAVALRNTSLHGLFTWVFTLPGAFLGLPWQVFATCYALNVAWQFWLHTRLIPKLGTLELVLNTPSHHRVHHGRDPEYVDRNFGGVLIVWDRLFGTFTDERHEPAYGVTPRLRSSDPVWANLHGWTEIGRAWRRAAGWRGRMAAVFGPPDWPEEPDGAVVPPAELEVPRPVLWYALAQFVLVLAAAIIVIRVPALLGYAGLAGVILLAGWTLAGVGGMLDGRTGVVRTERMRLAVFALLGITMLVTGTAMPLAAALTGHALASGAWLLAISRPFLIPSAAALPAPPPRAA